jgi:hypothetical protein
MTKKLTEIIANFIPEFKYGPRLELVGPFNRKAIDEVIQKQKYNPYAFSYEYEPGKGGAIFLIENKKSAEELVKKLNSELQEYGFFIEKKFNYQK